MAIMQQPSTAPSAALAVAVVPPSLVLGAAARQHPLLPASFRSDAAPEMLRESCEASKQCDDHAVAQHSPPQRRRQRQRIPAAGGMAVDQGRCCSEVYMRDVVIY